MDARAIIVLPFYVILLSLWMHGNLAEQMTFISSYLTIALVRYKCIIIIIIIILLLLLVLLHYL